MIDITAERAALAGMVLFSAACATGADEIACQSMDWTLVGREDGAMGLAKPKFRDRADKCGDPDEIVGEDRYLVGFDQGRRAFCSAEGGLSAGYRDIPYKDVCPPDSELSFLVEYDLGAELGKLEKDYDVAKREASKTARLLSRAKLSLTSESNRYNDPDLSASERFISRQDLEYYQRETARLTRALPKAQAREKAAAAAFTEFQSQLIAEGRLNADGAPPTPLSPQEE